MLLILYEIYMVDRVQLSQIISVSRRLVSSEPRNKLLGCYNGHRSHVRLGFLNFPIAFNIDVTKTEELLCIEKKYNIDHIFKLKCVSQLKRGTEA